MRGSKQFVKGKKEQSTGVAGNLRPGFSNSFNFFIECVVRMACAVIIKIGN